MWFDRVYGLSCKKITLNSFRISLLILRLLTIYIFYFLGLTELHEYKSSQITIDIIIKNFRAEAVRRSTYKLHSINCKYLRNWILSWQKTFCEQLIVFNWRAPFKVVWFFPLRTRFKRKQTILIQLIK